MKTIVHCLTRSNTAIIGSSLGALISYYGGLKYDQVFGKIGAPSPAFWFNQEIFEFTDTVSFSEDQAISFGGRIRNGDHQKQYEPHLRSTTR